MELVSITRSVRRVGLLRGAGLVSSVIALITWAPWYGDIFRVNRLAADEVTAWFWVWRRLLAYYSFCCVLRDRLLRQFGKVAFTSSSTWLWVRRRSESAVNYFPGSERS
jgi:hypothetical protein